LEKQKSVKDVGGTDEFREFFNSLSEKDLLKKEIRDARIILKEDCKRGKKIPHDRWPELYKKLRIKNLWWYRLGSGSRLVYTILSDPDGFLVSILEAFRTHQDYEERFGY